MLPKQIQVCSPVCGKDNLLTPACSKGKAQCLLQAPSKESRQLVLKRPEPSKGFQGKVSKDRLREGDYGVCDQLVDILLIGWW